MTISFIIYFNIYKLIVKTIKFTGEIPLDEKFSETVGHNYKIYKEDGVIYDCMLNQVIFKTPLFKINLISKINFFKDKYKF